MDPRRILVVAEGQLGDLLLLTPALRSLKKSIPGCCLTVVVVQRRSYGSKSQASAVPFNTPPLCGTSEVLTLSPFVDEVIEIQRPALLSLHGLARIRAELAIIRRLRSGKFDTAICCFPEDRFVLWAALSGASIRVGQNGQAFGWLLSRPLEVRKDQGGVLRYYCALAEAAGARIDFEETQFAIPAESDARALQLLTSCGLKEGEHFAVVHPGASGPYRVWPPERFAAVIGALLEEWNLKTLLCGTLHDKQAVDAVRSRLSVPAIELFLEESVADFAALMKRASICISNDSGPRHLAVSIGVPSIAILPKHNDRAWGAYGQSSELLLGRDPCPVCPAERCLDLLPEGEEFGSYCIRMVTVETVLDRVRCFFKERPA